jgi:hypothetical protein
MNGSGEPMKVKAGYPRTNGPAIADIKGSVHPSASTAPDWRRRAQTGAESVTVTLRGAYGTTRWTGFPTICVFHVVRS